MEKLEVIRNAQTDQFSVVLSRGNNSIRCMITIETGRVLSDEEKHRAALSKAKALAKALILRLRRHDAKRAAVGSRRPLWVKADCRHLIAMSALPPKADMCRQLGMSALCQ